MNNIKISILAAVLAASAAHAANPPACVAGTLDTYVALESQGGCSIGSYAFQNWVYTASDGNIPASAINVTPIASTSKPGFSFSVVAGNPETWQLAAGQSYSATIRVTAQALKTTLAIQDASLSVTGGQFEGGELLVDVNACLASLLGCAQPRATGSGIPALLEVTTTPGTSTLAFPGSTQSIDADINIALQGPASGTALTGFTSVELQYTLAKPPVTD
jgi:hypothetical protein